MHDYTTVNVNANNVVFTITVSGDLPSSYFISSVTQSPASTTLFVNVTALCKADLSTWDVCLSKVLQSVSMNVPSGEWPSSMTISVLDRCGIIWTAATLAMVADYGTVTPFSDFSLAFYSAPSLVTGSNLITFAPSGAYSFSVTASSAVLTASPATAVWSFPDASTRFIGGIVYTVSVPANTFQTSSDDVRSLQLRSPRWEVR